MDQLPFVRYDSLKKEAYDLRDSLRFLKAENWSPELSLRVKEKK